MLCSTVFEYMKKIGDIIWGKIYVLFFRTLYKLENTMPFWRLVNGSAVSHFVQHGRRKLSPVEERVVSDLKKQGIAMTSLDELFGNGDVLLKELLEYA